MLGLDLAIFEQNQSWNAAYSKLTCDLRVIVNIHFDDFDLASIFIRYLVKYRSNHFARTAPLSPVIHQHWDIGLQNIGLETVVGYSDYVFTHYLFTSSSKMGLTALSAEGAGLCHETTRYRNNTDDSITNTVSYAPMTDTHLSTTRFSSLNLPAPLIDALNDCGFEFCTEIQSLTLPVVLQGTDVAGQAQTGTGKTAAFLLATFAHLLNHPPSDERKPTQPLALILAPTRELADQIQAELASFSKPVRVGVVYGGVGYGPQLNALRRGVDILVACPGRLEDLIERRDVDLSEVNTVVLDEADRMADMGFMPAVKRLLDQTDPDRQTVLFSATLDGDVAALTERYQRDPVRHEVGDETPDITAATHLFWKSDRTERIDVAADAVTAVWPAIIFCRTRHGSDRLAKQLGKRGVKAAAIHGGRSQAQRTRALKDFSNNKVEALVATDVAARGIHVDGVALVLHFDPPEDHKTYIHRAGRTARAGEGGLVLSLVQPDQVKDTRRMQKRADLDAPIVEPAPAELRDLAPPPPARPKHTRPDSDDGPKGGSGGGGQSQGGKPRRRKAGQGEGGGQSSSRGPKKSSANTKPRSTSKPKRGPKAAEERDGRGPKKGSGSKHKRSGSRSEAGASGGKSGGPKRSSSGAKKTQVPNQNSGPGGKPNRKARRAHLQKQR